VVNHHTRIAASLHRSHRDNACDVRVTSVDRLRCGRPSSGGAARPQVVESSSGFPAYDAAIGLLPDWLSTIAQGLPVTHGVEAARELVAEGSFADVAPLLATEVLVGLVYATIGLFLVRLFEVQARRGASLELA
jgi:hypothetical protein